MSWSSLGAMSTHRHGLGVVVLEGPMYAVGGHDGWSYLNTVERYVTIQAFTVSVHLSHSIPCLIFF